MATVKQRAEKLAAELGVVIEVGGGRFFECTATAPKGRVFSATGTHIVVAQADRKAGESWGAILDDLNCGLEACTDPECYSCRD